MEVADMDWDVTAEEQLCQDLHRSNFPSQLNQSRHFSRKGQKELQSEYEKPEAESSMIRSILTAGRAAARSSAAASSAAQEASSAAAANAKTALEEVEKFVNILEGHKCDHWMSLQRTKKNINGSTRIERKTLADESKDESAMAASSDPFIDCDQKAKTSDAKERVSVKEKVSQIARRPLSSSKGLSIQVID